jgi:hypothetical protein
MVAEFNKAFSVPYSIDLRLRLASEETVELTQAMENAAKAEAPSFALLENVLKEMCDVLYTVESLEQMLLPNGLQLTEETSKRITGPLKAVINIFGPVNFEEAVRRVHASNMSKLEDGKPVLREDGKVLKGPNYRAPDLTDLVKPTLERLEIIAKAFAEKARRQQIANDVD